MPASPEGRRPAFVCSPATSRRARRCQTGVRAPPPRRGRAARVKRHRRELRGRDIVPERRELVGRERKKAILARLLSVLLMRRRAARDGSSSAPARRRRRRRRRPRESPRGASRTPARREQPHPRVVAAPTPQTSSPGVSIETQTSRRRLASPPPRVGRRRRGPQRTERLATRRRTVSFPARGVAHQSREHGGRQRRRSARAPEERAGESEPVTSAGAPFAASTAVSAASSDTLAAPTSGSWAEPSGPGGSSLSLLMTASIDLGIMSRGRREKGAASWKAPSALHAAGTHDNAGSARTARVNASCVAHAISPSVDDSDAKLAPTTAPVFGFVLTLRGGEVSFRRGSLEQIRRRRHSRGSPRRRIVQRAAHDRGGRPRQQLRHARG